MLISVGPDNESERSATAETEEGGATPGSRERRQAPRLTPEALPGLGSVTLYPRNPASLVNISSSGILLSCRRPLSPSAEAQLVLRGSDDEFVSGRVVRCQVLAVDDQGVDYAAAIECHRALDLDRYVVTMLATSPTLGGLGRGQATGRIERIRLRLDSPETLTVTELSEGGCFVKQPNRLATGDEVEFAFALPTGGHVALTGEVLGADPELGFAMRFVRLSAEQHSQLRHAVALVSTSADGLVSGSRGARPAPPATEGRARGDKLGGEAALGQVDPVE